MRTRTLSLVSGLALLIVALASTSASAEVELVPADRSFFLRGTGCGSTQDLWLSTSSGADEFDGCGSIGGLPVREVIHQTDGPDPYVLPARDGVPVILDASRDVAGTIRAESWFGDGVPGVGQVVVDIRLHGTTTTNQFLEIGSESLEALNTGSGGIQADFTIDVPDTADQVELGALTLDVWIHGVNWNSGNLGMEGDSNFSLPIFIPVETA